MSAIHARFSVTAEAFASRIAALPVQCAPAHVDDLYLATSCVAGDEAAWRECLQTHRPFMIQIARRVLGEPGASDLVDGVVADLWERQRLSRYQGRSSLRTWLGAVVVHAALNQRRSDAGQQRARQSAPEPAAAAPATAGREQDVLRVLQHAIAQLPAPLRVLVLMYYEQGLTGEETARALGISKSTVSRDLKTARAQIRAAADRFAQALLGKTLDGLRDDVDLDRLDLDLRAACASVSDETMPPVSTE